MTAEWSSHALRLADELTAAGKLSDPRLIEAVRATPRHEFVPMYYEQDNNGTWNQRSSTANAATVYANTVLITAIEGTGVLSSSTQPGLMTRMIEALHLADGDEVLEIGTGTGYNAALLTHRLGDDHVYSIDVEPDLVDLARARLANLGHHPTLMAGDGAAGLPDHAPFDAVIATCAVPAIPWAWVEQTRPGGVILTDLKPALGAGSLVRLTRQADDLAEGRFDRTYAAFMNLRHQPGAGEAAFHVDRDHDNAEHRTTELGPRTPWTSTIVWFLASFDLGPDIALGYAMPQPSGADQQPGAPTATWIATPDGSWAEVGLAEHDGHHEVAEGGPRRLWQLIETAHQTWLNLGSPGWDSFGLTVTPEVQVAWFDEPTGSHRWEIANTAGDPISASATPPSGDSGA